MAALTPIPERSREFSVLYNPKFLMADSKNKSVVDPQNNYLLTQDTKDGCNDSLPDSVFQHLSLEEHTKNKEEITKYILEWFETWQPWQKKTLLCGVTNRYY